MSAESIRTTAKPPEYNIIRIIAQGGMGRVYLARDLTMNREVVVKTLRPQLRDDEEYRLRFIREARLTAKLLHPNIVPVHYFGEDETGLPFLVMQHVDGRSLEIVLDHLREQNAEAIEGFPLVHMLHIFLQVCDALRYAHSRHIIHRDIKPENVMIGDFGEVVVMDWGLAKDLTETAVDDNLPRQESTESDVFYAQQTMDDAVRTLDGQVLGSPSYMAPEQAFGNIQDIDKRTDVYGLGGLLYTLLTLYPPHAVQGSEDRKTTITPPSEFGKNKKGLFARKSVVDLPHCPNNSIPRELSRICMKALAHDPDARYPTVEAMAADVHTYFKGL